MTNEVNIDKVDSLIQKLYSEAKTRDEIMMEVIIEFQPHVKPSLVVKRIKDLGIEFKKESWRSAVVKAFKENPELSQDEFNELIAGYLENIQNYKQHYVMCYSLANQLDEMIETK